jgi:PKD repeat protein
VAARDDASTLYFRYTYHGDYAANSPVETQMYLDVDDDATTGQFVADPGVGLDYVVVSTPTGFGLFEYDAATGQYTNTGTTSPHFVPDFVGNAHEVGVPLSAFSSTGSPGPGATVRILGLQFYGADTQNPQRDFVPDVGDMSFVVGAPGTTPTPVPTPGPGAETVVSVVLDGAPNGLQQYRITVSGATVVSTEPDLIGGGLFQEVAGGEGETFVTVRAADLVQGVGAFTDTRTLFTVTFVGDVDVDDLTLTVEDLRDDGSADMDPGRVRLVASSSAVFTGPVPGSGGAAPPTDLDGDGLYEDVDGDGDADFDDAIALAFVDSSALTPAQTAALDFDSDGDVDFDDAIELAFQV